MVVVGGGGGCLCVVKLIVTAEVGAVLFNFGLIVYSTNGKADLAPRAL